MTGKRRKIEQIGAGRCEPYHHRFPTWGLRTSQREFATGRQAFAAAARSERMPHVEKTMKTLIMLAAAAAVAATLSGAVPSANAAVAWCADSGFDNGPPRERGPGTGPYWSGEPSDCNSIWRRGYYRGTDPDPNIRQQLMRDR
jgi:hypothetical protein